jgi:non-specific serine/threonine protein kinase
MVVVPGGSGVSGSFAIGRTEVTVGNWNDYCKLSGVGGGDGQCKPAAGGVNDPVASLAVADIEKYAAWLSATTKATYRLPSSAEWLHAATATGEPIKNANCIDPAGRGKAPRDTAQNLGQDNAWGLRDVLGNVQEIAKTASGYEVRGGHFNNQLGQCRLDSVQSYDGRPAPVTGFRLVRELGPG